MLTATPEGAPPAHAGEGQLTFRNAALLQAALCCPLSSFCQVEETPSIFKYFNCYY